MNDREFTAAQMVGQLWVETVDLVALEPGEALHSAALVADVQRERERQLLRWPGLLERQT